MVDIFQEFHYENVRFCEYLIEKSTKNLTNTFVRYKPCNSTLQKVSLHEHGSW